MRNFCDPGSCGSHNFPCLIFVGRLKTVIITPWAHKGVLFSPFPPLVENIFGKCFVDFSMIIEYLKCNIQVKVKNIGISKCFKVPLVGDHIDLSDLSDHSDLSDLSDLCDRCDHSDHSDLLGGHYGHYGHYGFD